MASDRQQQQSMNLPIIDLDVYLNNPPSSPLVAAECSKAADALITYGALVLHDSRVSSSDNDTFLDLLEDYFAQPEAQLRKMSGPSSATRSASRSKTPRSRNAPSTSPVWT